jgi:EpsI family protein
MNARPVRDPWIAAILCGASGAIVFQCLGNATLGYIHSRSLFWWWCFQWVNPESESQHGFMVLGISLWMLRRNVRGEADQGIPSRGGACAAMLGGLVLHVLGFVAQQARVSILGLLLFAWGVLTLGGGRRWARASAFPLGFMLFAVPSNVLDSAGFWLRMWVVEWSAAISHVLGIAVIRNGTLLLAPDGSYNYDVAAACSGVRSLTAIAALAMLVGYLRFKPWIVRFGFLALSAPLVFLGNVARVVSIIVAARIGGAAWGDRAHEFMGYGVFVIVFGGLLLVAEGAARARPGWIRPTEARRGPDAKAAAGAAPWGVALATVLAAIGSSLLLDHVAHGRPTGAAGIALSPDGSSPVDLPVFLGSDWMGQEAPVTEVERQLLPADTRYSRKNYLSRSGPSKHVFLSIVLSGRDRTSIHRPELCLVGQGWTIGDSYIHRFSYPGAGEFPARILRVTKRIAQPRGPEAEVRQLVVYYFVGGDVVVADHWQRILHDSWNRVAHGRADRWAYVLFQTEDDEGDAAAIDRVQGVLNEALPVFQRKT